jgi:hypothetical protein
MVLLAHTCQNGLLCAAFAFAQLLLGTMSNAFSTLNCHLTASAILTALPRWTVSAAHATFLHVLVTTRVLANLSLGAVSNAKATLDHTVCAVPNSAFATNTLARTTFC